MEDLGAAQVGYGPFANVRASRQEARSKPDRASLFDLGLTGLNTDANRAAELTQAFRELSEAHLHRRYGEWADRSHGQDSILEHFEVKHCLVVTFGH